MDSHKSFAPTQSVTTTTVYDFTQRNRTPAPTTDENLPSETQSSSASELTARQLRSLTTQKDSYLTKFVTPPHGKSIKKLDHLTQDRSSDNLSTITTPSSDLVSEDLTSGTTATTTSSNVQGRRWTNRHERILSMVALVVGFGNVWGFPYNCLQWGGAFFIPYVVVHFLVGIPIYYLELIVGQYSSMSPPNLFTNLAPILTGLGWAQILINIMENPGYNVIMAWCSFYLASSFQKPLPWTTCNNSWNTAECFSKPEDFLTNPNITQDQRDSAFVTKRDDFAPFEFFNYHIYNLSSQTLERGPGSLQWPLAGCLLATWTLTFLCVIGSMRSIGIIVYFTTPVPMLVLFVLTIVGFTFKGAGRGISFYLTPNLTLLSDPDIWSAAGTQVLFSCSGAMGGVITLGSFSNFHNNCFVDTLWTLGVNALMSVISGFLVFSALGSMSQRYNITLKHVIADIRPETAFVAYAEALGQIGDFGVVVSAVFFLACLFLGLDTQFINVECISVALCDRWPRLTRKRWLLSLSVCIVSFAIGLPMCTERGILIFSLLHEYVTPYSLIYMAIFEISSVIYIYGWRRLVRDTQLMMGEPTFFLFRWFGSSGILWQWIWFSVSSPILFLLLLASVWGGYVSNCVQGVSRVANVIGYVIALIPFWTVLLFGVVVLVHQMYTDGPLRNLFKPTLNWCPARKRPRSKVAAMKRKRTTILDLAGVPPIEIQIKRDFMS